jgi:hypothetical protein
MNKLIATIIFAVSILSAHAQKIEVGAVGGLNLSFASAKEAGVIFHGSPGIRYALGGYADIRFFFASQPAVFPRVLQG